MSGNLTSKGLGNPRTSSGAAGNLEDGRSNSIRGVMDASKARELLASIAGCGKVFCGEEL